MIETTDIAPTGSDPTTASGRERSGLTTSRAGRLVAVATVLAGIVAGGLGVAITHVVDRADAVSALGGSTGDGASAGLDPGSANADRVTAVAAKVLPSVVTISVTGQDGSAGDEGTGVVITSNGLILTNNHVVSAAAAKAAVMTVTFSGGRIARATIVGRDEYSDLAVIRATGVSGLTPASLGDSSTTAVGQNVIAIGAPLGLANSVTTGVVSALNRPVAPSVSVASSTTTGNTVLDAIQTDAAINPGNSGGPLVDLAGNVLGINSALASTGSLGASESGSIGLGFAIPVNQAKWVAEELVRRGSAAHSLLGVGAVDPGTSAVHAGAVAKSVAPGSPAAKAGIKVGDIVTGLGGQLIRTADGLVAAVRFYRPGSTVALSYLRGGQVASVQVTLAPTTSS
ncbi:S1C family serine protease [Streptacidiphilus sp. EB103A]|uniref:S1C family serine protease n=1 Tax=Streptacidiphilus sp. EB103A TaxID=3156275 RepID=UPI003516E099